MKKLLISLLSLVMALGLCVGCGGVSSSVEQSSSETSSVEQSSTEDSSTEDSSLEDSSVEDSSVEDSSSEDSSSDTTKSDLNAAKAKLLETYEGEALEIGDTRTFAGSLTLGEVTYTLEWSFTTELKSVASAISLTKNANGTYTLTIKTDGSAFFDESSDLYVKAVISDGTDSVETTITYTLTKNTFGPY
ncbi:MAG: hypothetical protein J6A63_01315 [Clostridia bacterium]|nr:hypothetical protein [Clostridia bacterium]